MRDITKSLTTMNKLLMIAAGAIVLASCNNDTDKPAQSELTGTWKTQEVTVTGKRVQLSNRDSVIAADFAGIKERTIKQNGAFTSEDSVNAINEATDAFDQLFNLIYVINKDSSFVMQMITDKTEPGTTYDTVSKNGHWSVDKEGTITVNMEGTTNGPLVVKTKLDKDILTLIHNDSSQHVMKRLK
jgi:hypothetical protein